MTPTVSHLIAGGLRLAEEMATLGVRQFHRSLECIVILGQCDRNLRKSCGETFIPLSFSPS